jgi:hypothetical protein
MLLFLTVVTAQFADINLDKANVGILVSGLSDDSNVGFTVNAAGDLNRDGWDDYLIGAVGGCYVVYGDYAPKNLNLASLEDSLDAVKITADDFQYNYGHYAICNGIGDINDDGYFDIALAMYTSTGLNVKIYSGQNLKTDQSTVLSTMNFTGASNQISLAPAGDVNGDGIDDFMVGTDEQEGVVFLLYGDTSFSSTIDLNQLSSSTNGVEFTNVGWVHFGYAISSAGDFNDDGYDDILIGSYGSYDYAGAVFLIYGSNSLASSITIDTLTSSEVLRFVGKGRYSWKSIDYTPDQLGISVGGIGDFNGDGIDDIALGANNANALAGAVYVIYGSSTKYYGVVTEVKVESLTHDRLCHLWSTIWSFWNIYFSWR